MEGRLRVPPQPARDAGAALIRLPQGGALGRGPGLPLRVIRETQLGEGEVSRVRVEEDNVRTFTRSPEPDSPT